MSECVLVRDSTHVVCSLFIRGFSLRLFLFVFSTGDVAVKILKVVDPTPEQFQAFRNEVAVLR